MAVTRDFKATTQARALHDAEFRYGLLTESIECMLSGDIDTGKLLFRDYINVTIGFKELAKLVGKSDKSLMRMFSVKGNPTANNFFAVLEVLRKRDGVAFQVRAVEEQVC